MKNKRLSLRISERRMRLLQTYAATKDKTITSLVEDWIDSLNSEKVCSSSLREALPTTNDPN
ncbi:hypothetical protein LC608_15575 [Nostoc sp. XA010]|nr:hypothetical protein [Nostoc sp. XA010]